jgi:hypothetical protein
MNEPTYNGHCWECRDRKYKFRLSYFYKGSNHKWTHNFMCNQSMMDWRSTFQSFIENITVEMEI